VVFRNMPTAIAGRKLPLKRLLQAVEHAHTFLVAISILLERRLRQVLLQQSHIQVMDRFTGFTTAAIHPLNLVSHVSIVVLLGKL
jgi:hypothetical protein